MLSIVLFEGTVNLYRLKMDHKKTEAASLVPFRVLRAYYRSCGRQLDLNG